MISELYFFRSFSFLWSSRAFCSISSVSLICFNLVNFSSSISFFFYISFKSFSFLSSSAFFKALSLNSFFIYSVSNNFLLIWPFISYFWDPIALIDVWIWECVSSKCFYYSRSPFSSTWAFCCLCSHCSSVSPWYFVNDTELWRPFKNSFKYACLLRFRLLNQSSSVIFESHITPFSFLSESLNIS